MGKENEEIVIYGHAMWHRDAIVLNWIIRSLFTGTL